MNSTFKKIIFFLVLSNTILLAQSQITRIDSAQVFNKLLPYETSRVGTDFAFDSTHNCFYYSCGMGVETQPNTFKQGIMFVRTDLFGNPLDSTIAVDMTGTIYNISHGSILITSDSCLFLSTNLNDSLYLTKTTLDFDTLWQKHYYYSCYIGDALLTDNNSIVYAGCIYDSADTRTYRRGLIFKVDSGGNELWHSFIGVHSDHNAFRSLTGAYDGSYIAGGISYKYTYGDLYMARVDSAGNYMWDWRFVHQNYWEYEYGIVGIVPQDDSTFVAIGSYGNNNAFTSDAPYYNMRFIKFKINKQPVLDTIYKLDRVTNNYYYYYDNQVGVPGSQPDTGLYSDIPSFATGLKDGSIIVSILTLNVLDITPYSISKIYKISPMGKIIWGRQLRAIPFSFGGAEIINDIIPMPDGSFSLFGYLEGHTWFVYPWGQSLWLVHTDSMGCDGFGSCDTNVGVTFTPPLPDTMCVTDTFHTIAKLTGTNYSGNFNITFSFGLFANTDTIIYSWYLPQLLFTDIDTSTDMPLEITYHNYPEMLVKYELVASDTTFHSNLLETRDTTLLSGFTATHMPVYSPFPSHRICFIDCPDTSNAINTMTMGDALTVYPNPANDKLTVVITNTQLQITNIRFFDITGRQIKSLKEKEKREKYSIDVKDLPPGLYFIKVETNAGVAVRKFVKQ